MLQKRQEKKVENEARKTEALNQQLRDANRTMKEQLDQGKATLDGITQGGATMKKIAGTLDDMHAVRRMLRSTVVCAKGCRMPRMVHSDYCV